MSCSAVDVKDESTFLSEGVHETEVEKHSTTVEEVSLTSVAEVHQQDLVCEIVPETVRVKQTDSCEWVQQKELNHVTVQETNMLIKKESLAETDQEMDLHCETGQVSNYPIGEVTEKADSMVSSEVVHEIEESTKQNEEKLQRPQTWTAISKLSRAKIKRGSHKWAQRKDCLVLHCVLQNDNLWNWHFKYKIGKAEVELWLSSVGIINDSARSAYSSDVRLRTWEAHDNIHNVVFENQHATSESKRDRSRLLCLRLMKYNALSGIQFTLGAINFHLKHIWRFKQFKLVSVSAFGLEEVIAEWRAMLWVCSNFSMAVADTRPAWQISLIIFFYPSLWASLSSWAGVYESILICLWIVVVLIWRYDKEENVESELLIQELLQIRVSSFLN
ncbi:hypothetical protein F2Q70_00039208 [Brassica cretica]|uniref:Uncharacterized protein n=1 Tax=Brassica cretica TaxID=69181 RepID=A0A8S9KC33_BRACR|nr:hypothetical protein F2Q70_00039208 [Brassica cretica]